ncbi:EAL domain-containing protein [Vibrio atypicus]|uniref:EAL domain-containing protein n=1 Tax=Vibrio atypicus TaxID=558271 RepID=UPI001358D851|nr:EAL domain-containing protein [Vibrio atypicus]
MLSGPKVQDNKFRNVLDPSLTSIEWSWDIKHHKLDVDRRALGQLLHSSLPSVSGNVILSCLDFDDQARFLELIKEACRSQQTLTYACCMTLEGEQCCYVNFSFSGENTYLVKGHITPLLYFSVTTSLFNEFFQQLFENPHHGVILADSNKSILACNTYFLNHTGFSARELLMKPIDVLDSDKHSQDFYRNLWFEVEDKGYWSGVVLIKQAQGKTIPQDLTLQKVNFGERTFYLGYYLDISKNLYRVADVELGGVELLTQLPTESQFTYMVAKRWMNEHAESISMVVAFVPNFEQTDDFDLKSMLSEHLSRNRNAQFVGYIGNNHFVACLECAKAESPSQVRIIHQTIRRFFATLNHLAGKVIHRAIMKGKVGVSVLGHDTYNPKLLVSHAVQALLEQSNNSQGQITFYHGAIHKEVLRRKELEEWASKLIKSQSIEVFYQPIVDTKTWDIVKFEALSRFKGPNGQMLNTQEMVTIAEDLDLVSDLDWCVGKKALQELSAIQERFGAKLGVTINRSLNTKLEVDEVLQSAESLIYQYAKTPDLVTIELTESAYFDSESRQSSLIRNIRRKGVTVAIDDFGTGYSSFSYLSDSNFDLLKIDREFVTDIKIGSHKYFIVKMITELAHTLNVRVVAEGVETRHELEVLCGLGVDYIQGYFFSKPLPFEQLEKAWAYYDKLEDFLSRTSSMRKVGILTITQTHIPTLGPRDTVEQALALFNSPRFDLQVVPIVDGQTCLGIVGRKELNYHLTPTLGTKLETTRDLTIAKKRLNQVMQPDVHKISYQTKLIEISDFIRSGIKLPWVVENEIGEYLGIVTTQDVLNYFASLR